MKEVKIVLGGTLFTTYSAYNSTTKEIHLCENINEDIIELAFNYEYLHYILSNFISKDASSKLDNIYNRDKKTVFEIVDEYGLPCLKS